MSWPLSSTVPDDGSSTPVSRLMKVVLPAPFGPIRAWRAPASSLKLTSRAAAQRAEVLAERRGFRAASVMARRACARSQRAISVADAEDAAAREQRDDDQQQAEAELPGGRIELRQEVRQHHVGDGADEGAVEPAVAAEHQDDQHGRGAVEAERARD